MSTDELFIIFQGIFEDGDYIREVRNITYIDISRLDICMLFYKGLLVTVVNDFGVMKNMLYGSRQTIIDRNTIRQDDEEILINADKGNVLPITLTQDPMWTDQTMTTLWVSIFDDEEDEIDAHVSLDGHIKRLPREMYL